MAEDTLDNELPPIPNKKYFSISEVSRLCNVEATRIRYWEQEFTALSPKRRPNNRRLYQHHEVMLIRRIRKLLIDEGYTVAGARRILSGQKTHDLDTAIRISPTSIQQIRQELQDTLHLLQGITHHDLEN